MKEFNNDPDFQIYLVDQIDLTDRIVFADFDANGLLELISKPEFNIEKGKRYKPEVKEEIEKIRSNVIEKLSNIIDNTQGRFSAPDSMIEGIVLKLTDNGDQVGLFSKKYKETKKPFWTSYNSLVAELDDFIIRVFGASPKFKRKSIFPVLDADKDHFKAAFENEYPAFAERMDIALKDLEDQKMIPFAAHHTQLGMRKKNCPEDQREF